MRACVRAHSPPGPHAVSLAAEGGSKSGRELRAPDHRPGWIAVLATIVGAIVVVLLRQDPFENPDSRAFEAIARLHAFVPFQTRGGIALHVTHTDQPPGVDWAYMAEHPEMDEVGFDRYFSRAAIDAIRARPGAFVRRLTRGAFEYLGPLRDRRPDTWLLRFALLSLLLGLAWEDSRRRLALPAPRDATAIRALLPAPGHTQACSDDVCLRPGGTRSRAACPRCVLHQPSARRAALENERRGVSTDRHHH